ncbi:hypothetical protein EJ08DRAFT_657038 [Tothia fuscella]|uniref:Uncharacterized protein n=1 Tax=Tothia fuscella TaxID=1048955 RepID=A0A9P4P197_9PEZI|nr:hypothetical protein EJ08DRAFT_657038 [Tothia fuscella]
MRFAINAMAVLLATAVASLPTGNETDLELTKRDCGGWCPGTCQGYGPNNQFYGCCIVIIAVGVWDIIRIAIMLKVNMGIILLEEEKGNRKCKDDDLGSGQFE